MTLSTAGTIAMTNNFMISISFWNDNQRWRFSLIKCGRIFFLRLSYLKCISSFYAQGHFWLLKEGNYFFYWEEYLEYFVVWHWNIFRVKQRWFPRRTHNLVTKQITRSFWPTFNKLTADIISSQTYLERNRKTND